MDPKTALLLLALRMLGQRADRPADLGRLNAGRPYGRAMVQRAHRAVIEILAATHADHVARMARWRRGQERPRPFPADLTTAVSMKESSLRPGVVGKAGELSYLQVKPDGIATTLCPDLIDRLGRPRENILCGIRILRAAEQRCGPDPRRFLGRFNGTRECGPTAYADRVLKILDAAQPRTVALR